MTDAVESLLLDLLEWVARSEKSYQEVIDAWRTSCPKLPVWEEANDRGFLAIDEVSGLRIVRITSPGRAFLEQHRPAPKPEHRPTIRPVWDGDAPQAR